MGKRPPADLDLVNRLYERWTPYEDHRRNISDDLKELFAEGKGNGLNPKALRAAFAERYRIDNQTGDEAEKRLRNDEDFELYMTALARVRESGPEIDRSTGEVYDDRREPSDKIEAALRTSERRAKAAGKDKPVDIKHEPASHVAAAVGSDPADQAEEATGQDASSATQSTEAGTARRDNSTEASGHGQRLDPEAAITPPASGSAPVDTIPETPEPGAPAATGTAHNPIPVAVPGSIRTEKTPVEGLEWHSYLRVWPELFGREFAALVDDVRANGVTKPIIMQGNIVLDGRARYLAARQAGVSYTVQEYAGDDPLRDIIAWNMEARKPHLVARGFIAKALTKLVPDRADEIADLLDLSQQREAAQ